MSMSMRTAAMAAATAKLSAKFPYTDPATGKTKYWDNKQWRRAHEILGGGEYDWHGSPRASDILKSGVIRPGARDSLARGLPGQNVYFAPQVPDWRYAGSVGLEDKAGIIGIHGHKLQKMRPEAIVTAQGFRFDRYGSVDKVSPSEIAPMAPHANPALRAAFDPMSAVSPDKPAMREWAEMTKPGKVRIPQGSVYIGKPEDIPIALRKKHRLRVIDARQALLGQSPADVRALELDHYRVHGVNISPEFLPPPPPGERPNVPVTPPGKSANTYRAGMWKSVTTTGTGRTPAEVLAETPAVERVIPDPEPGALNKVRWVFQRYNNPDGIAYVDPARSVAWNPIGKPLPGAFVGPSAEEAVREVSAKMRPKRQMLAAKGKFTGQLALTGAILASPLALAYALS